MDWYKKAQLEEEMLDEDLTSGDPAAIHEKANEEALQKLPDSVVRKDMQQQPIRPPQSKQKLPGLIKQIFPHHEQQMDAQQAANAAPPAAYRFVRDLVMDQGVGDKLRQIRQRQPPPPLDLNPLAPRPTEDPTNVVVPTNMKHPTTRPRPVPKAVASWLGGNCRFAQNQAPIELPQGAPDQQANQEQEQMRKDIQRVMSFIATDPRYTNKYKWITPGHIEMAIVHQMNTDPNELGWMNAEDVVMLVHNLFGSNNK